MLGSIPLGGLRWMYWQHPFPWEGWNAGPCPPGRVGLHGVGLRVGLEKDPWEDPWAVVPSFPREAN